MNKNNDEKYINELKIIADSNVMYGYEDSQSDFLASQISCLSDGEYKIIVRSDIITPELFWHIRYLRSMKAEPKYLLTCSDVADKHKTIHDIDVITYNDLLQLDTSKFLLLIVNRESDFGKKTQPDYREDSFDFVFRQRAKIGYYRQRSIDNYFYMLNHKEEYADVIRLLDDNESKECFVECIRALVENDVYRKKQYPSGQKYFDKDIFIPDEREIWVNCGAATGDTILRFINGKRKCKKIYAIDIDDDMIEQLEIIKKIVELNTDYSIHVMKKKLHKGENSIDVLFKDENVSLINMDVEGAEMQILESAERLIRIKKPVLAVCAYHKPEDLIKIPKYLKSIQQDYHFFLRKYEGCWPDALNEYVYYAVPTCRLNSI